MPLVKLLIKPGMDSQSTQTQNAGLWFDGNLLRWRMGLLEKYPGWQRLISTPCANHIRKLHAWEDLQTNRDLLIGTDTGPQILVNQTLYSLNVFTSSFAGATSGFVTFGVGLASTNVQVSTPSVIAVGAVFTLTMPVSIGGKILAAGTSYTVTSVTTSPVGFTFTMPSASTYAEGSTGGIPAFNFNGANAFTTVTFRAHGLAPGNTFHVDQTTFLDGGSYVLIPAGTDITVLATPTADTFTFTTAPYGFVLPAAVITIGEGVQQIPTPPYFSDPVVIDYRLPVVTSSDIWFMDNLGANGLVVYEGSPLLVYTPPIESGASLYPVGAETPKTAPQTNFGMLVAMPQAQVILFGTEGVFGSGIVDPLLLRFSDVGTYDSWTATVTNQAGSYRLSRGSKIVGGIQSPQTTMIFTDVDVWSMSYIGPPLVYGFTVMGSGCGLIAPRAVAVLGRTTFWMSRNGFWQFAGSGAQPLPCPVWDFIFRDIDTENERKIFAAANSSANEIAFFFPSATDAAALNISPNMLELSQTFNAAPWNPSNLVSITTGLTAPDGSSTAMQPIESLVNGEHSVVQLQVKPLTAQTYTCSVYVKNTSSRNVFLRISDQNGLYAGTIFNPVTGTVVGNLTLGPWVLISSSIVTDSLATGGAGNGWYRAIVKVTTTPVSPIVFEILGVNGSTIAYAGNATSGPIIWGAMMSSGTTVQAYVATTILQESEPTRYVKYNALENLWDSGHGHMTRTAWLDNNIYGAPLGGDINFRIQQHETGWDDDGSPMRGVFAESGYSEVSDGTVIPLVDQCQPDMKWFGVDGGVKVTLKAVQYPGGPQRSFGPYSITPTTQYFSTRVRSKLIAMRYDWEELKGFSARVGATHFRTKPAGKRP